MNKYLQLLDEYQDSKPNTLKSSTDKTDKTLFVSNVSAYLGDIEFQNNQLPDEVLNTIHSWLDLIGETNQQSIEHVIQSCSTDENLLNYITEQMANQSLNNDLADDRRHCSQCLNLTSTGRCRGNLAAISPYCPNDKLPRRCEAYRPDSNDLDTRTGSERWPNLAKKQLNISTGEC